MAELVWEFYREVTAQELGGAVHYYDEAGQSIYLSGGLATNTTTAEDGHWKDAVFGELIQVTTDAWTRLRLDHPINGVLFGVAAGPGGVEFLRYTYAMDISALTQSWEFSSQVDSPITQLSAEVSNAAAHFFASEMTLFEPGSRLRFGIRMGDSDVYPMATIWLDEVQYDQTAASVSITGRNTTGYKLNDQTMDELTRINNYMYGPAKFQVEKVLEHAGVTDYEVNDIGGMQFSFEFNPDDRILSALEAMVQMYSSTREPATDEFFIYLKELPTGKILVGQGFWVENFVSNGYYSFDARRDLFQRTTNKRLDAAYTQVRVTGQDENNMDLQPVVLPVKTFGKWNVGKHKTKHIKAESQMTQEELQKWAEDRALEAQYVGISENMEGPFRPQLLVGDVAEVMDTDGQTGTSLGIITEVRHSFSVSGGYRTSFSVDSGGVVTEGENYVIYPRATGAQGYNRQQTIADLIRRIK